MGDLQTVAYSVAGKQRVNGQPGFHLSLLVPRQSFCEVCRLGHSPDQFHSVNEGVPSVTPLTGSCLVRFLPFVLFENLIKPE